jgi:hypothetical protein
MSFSCPECKKPLIPIKAAMGQKSICSFCKTRCIRKNSKTSQVYLLVFVGLATLLRYFLERYFNEYVALAMVIGFIIICGILITEIQKDDSYSK